MTWINLAQMSSSYPAFKQALVTSMSTELVMRISLMSLECLKPLVQRKSGKIP